MILLPQCPKDQSYRCMSLNWATLLNFNGWLPCILLPMFCFALLCQLIPTIAIITYWYVAKVGCGVRFRHEQRISGYLSSLWLSTWVLESQNGRPAFPKQKQKQKQNLRCIFQKGIWWCPVFGIFHYHPNILIVFKSVTCLVSAWYQTLISIMPVACQAAV